LLEKQFGWKGILSEPATFYHSDLLNFRRANIDKRAVFSISGAKVQFNETRNRALSTIDVFSDKDDWSKSRQNGTKYFVETVSLLGLLEFHKAPQTIGFLSIDTEGSEYEILRYFDFSKFESDFISIEHNFTNNREMIFELLSGNGYKRVHPKISFGDDWYIPEGRNEITFD